MAFINNTVTKDDIFIRVGEVYFGTTGTLSADSTNTVTVGSSYFANTEFVDKVIVFSNGKSKYITARTSDTVVSVSLLLMFHLEQHSQFIILRFQ